MCHSWCHTKPHIIQIEVSNYEVTELGASTLETKDEQQNGVAVRHRRNPRSCAHSDVDSKTNS
jgi:hypothetical protein